MAVSASPFGCYSLRMVTSVAERHTPTPTTSTTIAADTAALIAKAIDSRGFTRSSFAHEVGLSVATLSRKLNGHSDITTGELARFARVLGMAASKLAAFPVNIRALGAAA